MVAKRKMDFTDLAIYLPFDRKVRSILTKKRVCLDDVVALEQCIKKNMRNNMNDEECTEYAIRLKNAALSTIKCITWMGIYKPVDIDLCRQIIQKCPSLYNNAILITDLQLSDLLFVSDVLELNPCDLPATLFRSNNIVRVMLSIKNAIKFSTRIGLVTTRNDIYNCVMWTIILKVKRLSFANHRTWLTDFRNILYREASIRTTDTEIVTWFKADFSFTNCPFPIKVCDDKTVCLELIDKVESDVMHMLKKLTMKAGACNYGHIAHDTALNKAQMDAFRCCMSQSFTVITGAGGTGKTEIIAKIGQVVANENLVKPVFVAPTGVAAHIIQKRLEGQSINVSTIHKYILNSKEQGNSFLVIDEASMVSIWLTWHLFHAAIQRNVLSIVICGDPLQLPPVQNDGNILSSIVMNGTVPLVHTLTTNYRSEKGLLSCLGLIRAASHGINIDTLTTDQSQIITIPNDAPGEMFRVLEMSLAKADIKTTKILLSRKKPIQDPDDRFISRKEREHHLISILNIFNPIEERRTSSNVFYIGDEVRSSTNIYSMERVTNETTKMTEYITTNKLRIANGTLGKVICESPMTIRFENDEVIEDHGPLDLDEKRCELFRNLSWGNISTVHKAQGCEIGTVIVVMLGNYSELNTINMLYTAASRARNRLVLIMEKRTRQFYRLGAKLAKRNTRIDTMINNALN
jgi:hypothetical protein